MDFDKIIDQYKDEMVKTLIEVVSIPSVEGKPKENMPFGKAVDDALNYALVLSKDIGMEIKNIDHYAGHAEIGDGEETLGIVLHLDVVPAGDGWTKEPFKPKLEDDRIYGRGTTDNKGPFVAIMYAIKALIDSNKLLNRKVRVIFGTNEETRWEGINYYLEKEQVPDLTIVPDALFPLVYAEKGIVDYTINMELLNDEIKVLSLTGGNAINSVADECTIEFEVDNRMKDNIISQLGSFISDKPFKVTHKISDEKVSINVKGVAAHTSEPQNGANAIGYLSYILANILDKGTNLYEVMHFINKHFNYEDYHAKELNINYEDKPSGKLTNNIGLVNLVNNRISFRLNTRYPVTMNYQSYINNLSFPIENNGYAISIDDHLAPVYKSLVSEEAQILLDTYREVSKDNESQPISMGGGTYARALPNAIAYGGQIQRDPVIPHQDDEYVTIENLMLMARVYMRAIYRLANFEGKFK